MSKVSLILALAALMLAATACKSRPSGSREFIPGKGWAPAR